MYSTMHTSSGDSYRRDSISALEHGSWTREREMGTLFTHIYLASIDLLAIHDDALASCGYGLY